MKSIIANIVVALVIFVLIFSAVRALKKPNKCSKRGSKDGCAYCHNAHCSDCKR